MINSRIHLKNLPCAGADSCGRPELEHAIQHAHERAVERGRRQRVTIQRDRFLGPYYLIREDR